MYYNENTIIYFDGEFIKATAAKANVYDQSLHYGYAAFEGIRAYNTQNGVTLFKAKEHYERMEASCHAIGIPYAFDTQHLIDLTYEVLEKNNFKDAYIRPLVSCSPNMSLTKGKDARLLIAAWEWDAYLGDKLLRLATSSYRRITPASFKVEAKISGHYVNSILASQQVKDLGFDEALLLDLDGFVAEGPGSNFFLEQQGILYTPQAGSILPGITRATVIEICKGLGIEVIEKQILLQDVHGADSAFLCGTAAEIIGIESLDKIPFKKQWHQTLGATIQKAYRNLVVQKRYQPELSEA